jgi:hypothetical protein
VLVDDLRLTIGQAVHRWQLGLHSVEARLDLLGVTGVRTD